MAVPARAMAEPIDADAERYRLAAELEALGTATGDGRFGRAAGILRGAPGGRPAADDADALAEMAALLRESLASSPREAARMVALAGSESVHVESSVRRLAKKYEAQGGKYFDPAWAVFRSATKG